MSKVILLTGPAGAGKSTTAKRLSDISDGTWAYINQDDIRHFIKSGFANPTKPWTDETHKQWKMSVDICCFLVKTYQENHINCVVDAFITPDNATDWEKMLEGIEFKLMVLLPDVQTTLKRNTQRKGDAVLPAENIKIHHEMHSGWKEESDSEVIDSTDLTVDDVVNRVSGLI